MIMEPGVRLKGQCLARIRSDDDIVSGDRDSSIDKENNNILFCF